MASQIENLLITGKYADLVLRCHEVDLKVHRAIVCSQSPVLAAAVDGPFQEAQSSVIELHDDDLNTVRLALSFLYSRKYNVQDISTLDPTLPPENQSKDNFEPTPDETIISTLQLGQSSSQEERDGKAPNIPAISMTHVDIYGFADKYDIPELKELAATKFKKSIEEAEWWDSKDLAILLQKIYSSTPSFDKVLRDIIVDFCSSVPTIEVHLSNPEFAQAVSEVEGIGLDFITRLEKRRLQEVQDLKKELSESGSQVVMVDYLQGQLNHMSMKFDQITDRMDNAIQITTDTSECRQCKVDFDSYLESSGAGSSRRTVLRCRRCRTRHSCS
ncbi:MAG: hypothetical protein M1836_001124 [Candelina mexicana]|nr:MAG: hypothetical protein M1836_001124 [Candelina mexicana]